MATISNIIQTIFQSSGANNTNRDIDNINRNMTRLGQTSASAGRSFAAQSQGLGGLVAAYAGAAATTFALQQAFDKLAQSARQSQTLEGLNTLAARSGESSTILLENVRELTKNQLTLAEAASQINLSLSAGFDSTQIEGLSEVALKASRALGRDLNDAYTRVVRGSAKLETELLDELGIYTKIEPATRAYALAMNKNVNELTEFERRQAFVNSVIEEGNRKFSSINTTIPTTAEKIEAFGTRILDIAGILGRFLADQVAPLADFLTNNLTASFAAFGAIASLVAGKGVAVLRDGLNSLTANIVASGAAAEQGLRKFLGISKATATASAGIKNYSRELVGVTTKEKEQFKALQASAQSRNLSNKELTQASAILKKNRAEIDRVGQSLRAERTQLLANKAVQQQRITTAQQNIASLRAERQALIQAGASLSQVQTKTLQLNFAQATLNATTTSATTRIATYTQEIEKNREAIRGNISSLRALQKAEEGAAKATGLRGKAAGLLSKGYEGVATTLGAVGNAFTSVVSKALGIFSLVSLFTLLGSSIAEVLGKGEEFDALVRQWGGTIKSIFVDSDAKRISNTIQGIAVGALEELEKTDEELRDIDEFTFKSKVVGLDVEVTKTKEDLVREVNAELTSVLNNSEAQAGLDSWGSKIGGVLGAGIFAALGSVIPGLGNLLGLSIGAAAGSYIGRIIQDALSDGELTIGDLDGGQEALDSLKTQYSETFAAVGEELEINLAKGFQNIENRLGKQAIFDPIARQALEFQKNLFAESGKYLNNIESISKLMAATGQSANVITREFTLEKGVLQAQQFASTIISLADENYQLNFSFMDSLDKDLKSFLDNTTFELSLLPSFDRATIESVVSTLTANADQILNDAINAADSIESINEALKGADVEGVSNINEFLTGIMNFTADEATTFINELNLAFNNSDYTLKQLIPTTEKLTLTYSSAKTAVDTLQQSLARSAFNTQDLIKQLSLGNVDLETFDQRMKAVSNSTANANNEYKAAAIAVKQLADLIEEGTFTSEAEKSRAYELLTEREIALALAEENLRLAELYTEELGRQRQELVRQKELSEFLSDLTKNAKPLNIMSTQMELMEAGLPEEGKLVARISFLEKLAESGKAQLQEYEALEAQLKRLNIVEEDRLRILSTSSSEVDTLVVALNKGGNTLATYEGGVLKVAKAMRQTGDAATELTGTFEEIDIQEDGGRIAADTQAILDTIQTLVKEAATELPKLISSALSDFSNLTKELNQQIDEINKFELPRLSIEADLDRYQFDLDMAKLQGEQFITSLELDLDINELKRELGDITPEVAIEKEGRIQQQILDKREEILLAEIAATTFKYEDELKLLDLENEQNIASIKAEAAQMQAEIDAQMAIINTYYALYQKVDEVNSKNVNDIAAVYDKVNAAMYKTIVEASKVMYQNIVSANQEEPGGVTSGSGPTMIDFTASDKVDFSGQLTELKTAYEDVTKKIKESEESLIEVQNTTTENAKNNLDRQFELEQQGFINRGYNLEKERELEDLRARERIKNLEEERAKGSDKAAKEREKALKELEKFWDEVEKGLKQLKKLAADLVKLIFDGFINAKQNQVAAATISEELSIETLSYTTERLNSVQTELNDALNKETSLKDELLTLTEKLNETQKSYLEALTDGDLVSASKEYTDTILEQSRKTIELNRVLKDRAILESAAQTLEQQQVAGQQAVEQATRSRMEREEELARIQEISAAVTSLMTQEVATFTSALKDLGPVLAALTGQVSGGVPGISNPIMALTQSLGSSLDSVFKAANVLKELGGASGPGAQVAESLAKGTSNVAANVSTTTAAKTALQAGENIANSLISKSIAGITGALSGAGIGSAVGSILGDDTWASTIGGAVGGFIATAFSSSAFVSGITGALTGAGLTAGVAASFATFGLSLVGALIFGSLFGGPKKPSAEVRGTATEEGFGVTDINRKDGLSQSAANQLGDFVTQVYDSIFLTLDRLGITFKDSVDVFVRNTEGEFGRVRTTFASGFEGTAADLGKSSEKAAKELVKEFFQGVTVKRDELGAVTFRSLVVDALTPNREDLQQAVDTFAELDDINKKTQERFIEGVQFAQKFSEQVSALSSAAPSLADSLELIADAAEAQAFNLLTVYNQFQSKTEEFFGENSAQALRAAEATRKNALAYIGLAEATDGSFVSLAEYTEGVTAGRLAIEKTVRDIAAFEMVLLDLGFSAEKAQRAVVEAIDIAVTEQVSEFANNISRALKVIKDPAQAAVFELEEVQRTAEVLIREAGGLLEGVTQAQSEGLATLEDRTLAEQAYTDAQELGIERIKATLVELSIAQLKAASASSELFDTQTQRLIQEELLEKQTRENFEATQRFVSALNDFNNRVNDITGDLATPVFSTNMQSLQDIMAILGETDASQFAKDLQSSVNGIQATNLTVESVTDALGGLQQASANGDITLSQYADSLILISDTALNAIEQQEEAVNKFEEALDELENMFNSSLNEIQRAITNLRDELVNLVDAIDDSTTTIFDIYDSTLADIANSGNELFDLRDSAREAFKASADAVRQFEAANSLSGKSASQINAEIGNIQNSIDSLLSGNTVSFEAFRQLSELTARQNALRRELSNVIAIESEYKALLDDRQAAAADLAFAEATVLELGDQLVDTRISESEIIRQVQQATTEFVSAQEDLVEITQLLAENNFDLNQIRKDENQRVREVSVALQSLETDLVSLRELLGALLSDSELRDAIETAAADLGERVAANLQFEEGSLDWETTVQEQVAKATTAFEEGLIPLANTLNSIFDFNLSNITGVNDSLEVLSVSSSSLTTKFNQFNTDLVKYLDTEGLSQFYGTNGVFSQFKNSLLSTLVVNGFDILTATNGPLDGFQVSAANIEGALIDLANVGATTIISVEGASDALTSLVQVIGADANGLTTAINSLLIVGDLTTQAVQELQGSIDGLYINLSSLNNLNITFDAGEEFDNIINSVTTFNAELGDITITTNLDAVYNDIKTQVLAYNSTLGDIEVIVNAAELANSVATDIVAYNSTLENISVLANAEGLGTNAATDITGYNNAFNGLTVDVDPNSLAEGIVTAIRAYNSTFSDISVTTNASNFAGDIVTDILAYNSKFDGISVTANADTLGGKIATDIVGYNSKFDNISVNVDAEQLAAGIITAVTGYNSEFEGITVNNKALALAGSIVTDVKAYNSELLDINITNKAEDIGGSIKTSVTAYNSTLRDITVDTRADEIAGNIKTSISTYNTALNDITVTSAASVATKILNDITTYKTELDSISVNVAGAAAEVISSDINLYETTLDSVAVNVAQSAAEAITADIEAYTSEIGEVTISAGYNSGAAISSDVGLYETTVGTVSINVAENAAKNIKSDIDLYESTIDTIIIDVAGNLAQSIITDVNAYRSAIEQLILSISGNDAAGSILTDIDAYETGIGTISVDVAENAAIEIKNDIVAYNSTVGSITISNVDNTVGASISNSITAYNSTVDSIAITNELNNVAVNIENQVDAFYSDIGNIAITNELNTLKGKIKNQVNAFYSDIDNIAITNELNIVAADIENQVDAFYSDIGSIAITNELNTLKGTINNQVRAFYSSIGNITITNNLNEVAVNIENQVDAFYSDIGSIAITNELNTLKGTINNQVRSFYSSIGNIVITNSLNEVAVNIENQVDAFYSDIGNIAITNELNTVSGKIKNQVRAFYSSIGSITITNELNTVASDIENQVDAFYSDIGNIAISNILNTVSGKIKNQVRAFYSTIGNIAITNELNTVAADIENQVDAFYSNIGSIYISNILNTVSGKIRNQVNAFYSTIGNIAITNELNTVATDIENQVDAFYSDIGNIAITNELNTVSGKIKNQVNAFYSTIDSILIRNSLNTVATNIENQVDAFYSDIGSITIKNDLNTIKSNLVNQINGFYSSIDNITIKNDLNTIKGNLVNQITGFYSSMDNLTINNDLNTVVGDILDSVNFYNDSIANLSVFKPFAELRTNLTNSLNGLISDVGRLPYSNKTLDKTAKSLISDFFKSIRTEVNSVDYTGEEFDIIRQLNDIISDSVKELDSLEVDTTTYNNFKGKFEELISSSISELNFMQFEADPVSAIQTAIDRVFSSLFNAFTLDDVDAVTQLTSALQGFSAIAQDLRDVKEAIADFTANSGLDSLKKVWDDIIDNLKTAWQTVNSDVSKIPDKITVTSSAPNYTDVLDSIAANSGKFAAITGESDGQPTYATRPLATGGYVDGPGTATSDSIPARLSKGEYVIRAASVSKLGKDVLDSLNYDGDLNKALSSKGRYGDELVAHINRKEAVELVRMGGSGTRNPSTGLMEFFSGGNGSSSNAYGGLFSAAEARRLHNDFKASLIVDGASRINLDNADLHDHIRSKFSGDTQYIDKKIMTAKSYMRPDWGNNLAYFGTNPTTVALYGKQGANLGGDGWNTERLHNRTIWSTAVLKEVGKQTAAMHRIVNQLINARRLNSEIGGYTNAYGVYDRRGENKLWTGGTAHPSLGAAGEIFNRRPTQNMYHLSKAKFGNTMSGVARDNLYSQSAMQAFITSANKKKKMFFDFYMLGKGYTNEKAVFKAPFLNSKDMYLQYGEPLMESRNGWEPTNIGATPGINAYVVHPEYGVYGKTAARGGETDPANHPNETVTVSKATGGLIRGLRDSVPAMLEPGEFVLRKAAVNRMGLDAAVQLNSTGRVDSDTNVEVNVINNGTAQQPVSEPVVRRENGKIVVDVILEDLRNNGPIKRQIRSIR